MNKGSVLIMRILSLALLAISLLTGSCERSDTGGKGKLDIGSKKVLAKVNGEPVYEGEVFRRIQAAYGTVDREKIDPNRWQRLIEASIESEIIDSLLLQAAVAEGIEVPPEDIRSALKRSKEILGDENFLNMLKERKVTEDEFGAYFKDRELINRYKAQLFSTVAIDDKTLREYYEGHKDRLSEPESVRIEVIAVEEKKSADEIFRRWGKGEAFEKLNEEYSQGKEKPVGARTTWMPYDAMPMGLQPQVREGKVGEILKPVESNKRFYVIKILEKHAGKTLSFEEAKDRVRQTLMRNQEQKIIDTWYEAEKQKAKIEYVK